MTGTRRLDLPIAIGAYVVAAALHLGLLAAVMSMGGGPPAADAAGRIELVTLPPQTAIATVPAASTDGALSGSDAPTIAAVAPVPRHSAERGSRPLTLLPVDAARSPSSSTVAPPAPVAAEMPHDGQSRTPSDPNAMVVGVAPSSAIQARPLTGSRGTASRESHEVAETTLRPVDTGPSPAVRTGEIPLGRQVETIRAPSSASAIQPPSARTVPRAAAIAASERPADRPIRSPVPIRPRQQTAVAVVGSDARAIASDRGERALPTSDTTPPLPSGDAAVLRPLGPAAERAAASSSRVAAVAPRITPEIPGSAAEIGSSGEGREVRDFLRFYGGSGCFIAVATQVERDRFAVSGFSRTKAEWTAFNRALDSRTGYRFEGGSRQVSEAQCAALAFARRQPDYPAFATRVSLERDRLASGEEIAGQVFAPRDRRVSLLLVDDEGRVQDVSRLLRPAPGGGGMIFRTPLTLTAGPVSTVQLLVALASHDDIGAVPADGSLKADVYFAELSRLLEARDEGADIAVASFIVE